MTDTISLDEQGLVALASTLKSLRGKIEEKANSLEKIQNRFDENIITEDYTRELSQIQTSIADISHGKLREVMYEMIHTADRIDHLGAGIIAFLAEIVDLSDETYNRLQLGNADIAFRISPVEPEDKDDALRYAKNGDHYDANRLVDSLEGEHKKPGDLKGEQAVTTSGETKATSKPGSKAGNTQSDSPHSP